MPNYQNGKIYCIRSHQTDKIYIGSTTKKYLTSRIAQHKTDYKRWIVGNKNYVSSYEILQYPDCYIELLENYPCESAKELHKREGELIKETSNVCNLCIAGRTRKQYNKDNAELLKQKAKEYRVKNPEKIKTLNKKRSNIIKQWHQENPEKVKAHKKKSYDKFVKCECGKDVRKNGLNRHKKSQEHDRRLKGIEKPPRQDYKANRRVRVNCPKCKKEMSKASLTRHLKNMH